MKRLAVLSVLLFVAPLALGACRHDPTAPDWIEFDQSRPSGDIRVAVVGSLTEPQPGMAVTLDGGPPQGIAPGEAEVFANVPAGEHLVRLRNVDKRCLAEGGASRQVIVRAGQTASVNFFVNCGTERPWKPQN